jgi:LTXXQ motif family protein
MHPWTIAIAGAVALSLAGPSPGDARPKLGSAMMPEAVPVFWPDAPANLIEYLLFPKGSDERFWRYGYGAIMNATFADSAPRRLPLAGKVVDTRVADASATVVRPALSPSAVDPCGSGTAAADADAWVARIEQAITPAAPQREVVERLRSALAQAIERITAACPSAPPATPTERLQAIQDRIWAMRDALLPIRLPFESLYGSLTQEQQWRLNRASDAREIGASGDVRSEMCAEPAAIDERPMRAIERAVRPTGQQRASFDALRLGSAGMAQLIMSSCPTYPLLGHMGRFAAASDRLDVMLFAVMTMSPAVQGFYGSLDDRQRADFHRAVHQLRRAAPVRTGS